VTSSGGGGGELGLRCTEAHQLGGQLGVPGGQGPGGRCGTSVEGGDQVDAVRGQEAHPIGHAVGDGPGQLRPHQVRRRRVALAYPGPPRAAVPAAQTEGEEENEVIVVGFEHPVVQSLGVIGIRPRVEKQPGQAQGMGMVWLAGRSGFASTEDPGQHGERGKQTVPQVSGVGVGSGLEQQPGCPEHGCLLDVGVVAGIGQVHQRFPSVRSPFPAGGWTIIGQEVAQCRDVTRRSRSVNVIFGEVGIGRKDLPSLRPLLRSIVVIVEAGLAQEPLGRIDRSVGGQAGREPAKALHRLDAALQT
jgi:hypothetical protein